MQRAVGDAGLLGRYGGEEFVVLLPGVGKAEAMAVAARLKQAIDEPFAADSPMAKVGSIAVSIGVAAREDGKGVDEVLAKADAALYRAKAMGRRPGDGRGLTAQRETFFSRGWTSRNAACAACPRRPACPGPSTRAA